LAVGAPEASRLSTSRVKRRLTYHQGPVFGAHGRDKIQGTGRKWWSRPRASRTFRRASLATIRYGARVSPAFGDPQ